MSDSRRSFKCKFNPYVTADNRDAIIQSLIQQFAGLFADPEVTVEDSHFTITLTISKELPPTLVRDKLLWNYFIETVTVGEGLRRLKILSLPKVNALTQEIGAGQLDGMEANSGVDEVLTENGGNQVPQEEFKIDMGDRPDGPPVKHKNTVGLFGLGMSRGGSWIKQADPGTLRGEGAPTFTEGFGGADQSQEVVGPQDLDSKATKVDELPKAFANFNSKLAISPGDAGGFFGESPARKYDRVDVTSGPHETLGPVPSTNPTDTNESGAGLPSRANSWYADTMEQDGTQMGFSSLEKGKTGPLTTNVIEGKLKGSPEVDGEPNSGQELPGAAQFGTGNTDDDGNTIMQDSWGNRFCSKYHLDATPLHFAYDNEAGHHDEDDDDNDGS